MAQTIFINITTGLSQVSPSFRERDGRDEIGSTGAAAAGDLTVSIDTTNVKTLTQIKNMLNKVLLILAGRSEFTR